MFGKPNVRIDGDEDIGKKSVAKSIVDFAGEFLGFLMAEDPFPELWLVARKAHSVGIILNTVHDWPSFLHESPRRAYPVASWSSRLSPSNCFSGTEHH